MLAKTIHGSAHSIPLPDQSVHAVITSPPYYGLRQYAGEQSVEWPTVEYYPMPGLEDAGMSPLVIQGCDPACDHEWGEAIIKDKRGVDMRSTSLVGHQRPDCRQLPVGQYCQKCGGWRGGLGSELTIEAFIGHLLLCLREWWRVLRNDGCCLVNLGDSYNSGSSGSLAGSTITGGQRNQAANNRSGRRVQKGLAPKNLMMIPARFALAAQADGWTLRSDIIWAKGISFLEDYAGSCMPESVTDRPTKSHEYIYLLTKGPRYFWDKEAVKEPALQGYNGSRFDAGKSEQARRDLAAVSAKERSNQDGATGRSLRSVWVINPGSYPEAHFATYPPALVEPMIKATTSQRGCCPACGAQWQRVTEKGLTAHDGETGSQYETGSTANRLARMRQAARKRGSEYRNETTTTDWKPTCKCDAGDPVPSTVLDPFVGSGTTLQVATALNRASVGVDISADYLTNLVPARLAGTQISLSL